MKEARLSSLVVRQTIQSITTTLLVATVVSGCGGGGGSGANPISSSALLTGTAATGAPFTGATITVNDATGVAKHATGTTDADGVYHIDVTGLAAPFVITAAGSAADGTSMTLVSLLDKQPPLGATTTVNITPITHVIAARLSSSGNPSKLDAKADAVAITGGYAQAKADIVTLLKPLMTAAKVAAMDPVSDAFSANHTGLDQVIDSLKVAVNPDGTLVVTNQAAAIFDDASSAAPPAVALPGRAAAAPTIPLPAAIIPATDTDAIRAAAVAMQTALNKCFALPAKTRIPVSGPISPLCDKLIDPAYKNDGKTAGDEFGILATDPAMDHAQFDLPHFIAWQTADYTQARVAVNWTRSDGTTRRINTVLKQVASGSDNAWMFYGNQRDYYLFTNAAVAKRDELNPNAALPSTFQSTINLYFNATIGKASLAAWVKVTGPGLGNGVVLKPSTGTCSYLTIVSNSDDTTAARRNTCTSTFRLTGISQDGKKDYAALVAPFTTNSSYAATAVPDGELQAILPMSAYTWVIHDNSGTETTLIDRLRSRPFTLNELTAYTGWGKLSDATRSLLDPASNDAFAGGTSFPVAWTPGAVPIDFLNVQIRSNASTALVESNPQVTRNATQFSVAAPASTSFPSVRSMTAATPTNGGFAGVELSGRDSDDRQLFRRKLYDVSLIYSTTTAPAATRPTAPLFFSPSPSRRTP